MKKFLTVAVFAVMTAVPLSVLGAVKHLPIGSPEETLQHILEHTDVVSVSVGVQGFLGQGFYFSSYLKDDGTSENINAVTRRSKGEFEKLLQRMERFVAQVIDRTDLSLAGKEVRLMYTLETLPQFADQTPLFAEMQQAVLTIGADGMLALPEELFALAPLSESIRSLYGRLLPLVLPGIIDAEVIYEHEGVLVTLPATQYPNGREFRVEAAFDILVFASYLITDPSYKLRSVKTKYRGGTEQTFDGKGNLTETTLPDLRPITGVQIAYGSTVFLTVKAKQDEDLRIDFASVLGRWEEQPNPTLTKAGQEELVFSLPKRGDVGFFQARVVPSTIRVR